LKLQITLSSITHWILSNSTIGKIEKTNRWRNWSFSRGYNIFIYYSLMKSRSRRCGRQRRRRRRYDLDVYGERTWNANSFPRSLLFTKIVWLSTMDLSTTPRRTTEGVGELQKTRVAKSVFSIRSLVDVEETELPTQDDERPQSKSLDSLTLLKFIIHRATSKKQL